MYKCMTILIRDKYSVMYIKVEEQKKQKQKKVVMCKKKKKKVKVMNELEIYMR